MTKQKSYGMLSLRIRARNKKIERGEKTRTRITLTQKLAFVKSRSRTKFKTTFCLSPRESYFTGMVGCLVRGERTTKQKDVRTFAPFESRLNKNII